MRSVTTSIEEDWINRQALLTTGRSPTGEVCLQKSIYKSLSTKVTSRFAYFVSTSALPLSYQGTGSRSGKRDATYIKPIRIGIEINGLI